MLAKRLIAFIAASVVMAVVMGGSRSASAKDYVIAISPEITSIETRKLIGTRTMEFVFGPRIKPGDRLVVLNAKDLSQVAVFAVPDHALYNYEASRRKVLEKPTADFITFIAKKPVDSAASLTSVALPKLFAAFAGAVPSQPTGTSELEVMVLGNPLHIDPEAQFSMDGGRVPSDAHLTASIEDSLYGLDSPGKSLKGTRVHWLTLGAEWQGDLHERRMKRFWAAYVDLRGGALTAFKADVKSVFDEFGARSAIAMNVLPPLDTESKRLSMDIVRRDAENRAAEPLFETTTVKREQIVALPPKSKLRIGLRWVGGTRADIDLYAKTKSSKQWTYFGEPQTSEGRFFKFEGDPSKPARGFEYVEFSQAVNPTDIEIAINFYEGHVPGGPKGQVRLDIGGVIHEVDFQIKSQHGNKGIGFPDKMGRHPAWVLINANDIVSGKLNFVSGG